MARPRRQSRRQRQGKFHVQVPKLPEDQALAAKDVPRRGQSCEVRSHPTASMQWNQNDTATNKQGQPETSTVFTVSRYVAGGTSTRSSWLSHPLNKRLIKQLIECCRGKIDTIFKDVPKSKDSSTMVVPLEQALLHIFILVMQNQEDFIRVLCGP
ncbi:hypothetical protein PENARI_c049G00970, partial [Penicillium arizonense]